MPHLQGHNLGYNNTQTSLLAALEMLPVVGTIKEKVLAFLRSCGENGATNEDVAWGITDKSLTGEAQMVDYMKCYRNSQPRTRELVLDGLVIDSGRTRKSKYSGKQLTVWKRI